MRELISITKVLLNSTYGFSMIKYRLFKQKKELWKPILIIIALFSLIPAYKLYVSLINNIYISLFSINQEGALFTIVFVAGSIIVLIFGIAYAMSFFYFSKDTEQFLPLPIKQRSIILGKFITMLTYEYLLLLPFVAPIFIIAYSHGNIMYIIYSLLSFLLLPVIPLGLSTVIVMILMKYTNIQGKKDLIRTISLFIILIIMIGFQVVINKYVTSLPSGGEEEFIRNLINNNNSLIELAGSVFPPAIWVSKALTLSNTFQGLLYFILFLCISLLMIFFIVFIGERIYLKGILSGKQKKIHTNNKINNKTKEVKYQQTKPPFLAIFINDFKLIARTPIYIFNCLSIAILLPVLLIGLPIFMGDSGISELLLMLSPKIEEFNLGLVGLFIVIGGLNPTASTTYSREGKCHWIGSIMPIEQKHHFWGRMLTPLIIQFFTIVFMLIGISIMVSLDLSTIIISLVFGIIGSLPVMSFGILVDLFNPLLDWDNPQKAVKQNLNVLISMIVTLLYVVGLAFLVIKLISFNIAYTYIYILLFIIFIILSYVMYKIYYNKVQSKLMEH